MTNATAPLASLILAAILAVAADAWADDPGRALEIGLRAGVGLPFGKVDRSTGDDLSQTIAFTVPVVVDVGYRVDPSLLLGLYGAYAFAAPASALRDECSSNGVHCSTDDFRLGVEAQIHGFPTSPWDPWIGIGTGYEWMRVDAGSGRLATFGWEILHIEAGLDLRSMGAVGLGPFVEGAVGEYEFQSLPGSGTSAVTNRTVHEWLVFGLRAVFDLRPDSKVRESAAVR